jgi:hypothetical protein
VKTPGRGTQAQPGAESPEPTEAERFEELAKALIKVPKSEIDAERAKRNGQKRDR